MSPIPYELAALAYRAFAEINEGGNEYCEAAPGRMSASSAFQQAARRHAAFASMQQTGADACLQMAAKAHDPRDADNDRDSAKQLRREAAEEAQLAANAAAAAADEPRAAASDYAQCN